MITWVWFRSSVALVLGACLIVAGCGDEPTKPIIDDGYLPHTSPENVLWNLQTAYKFRNIDAYASQLAYDFRFEFDPGDIDPETQPDAVWHFEEDSLSARNMFNNENLPAEEYRVLDIRIRLTYGASVLSNDPERAGQRYILVTNVALDVDTKGGELGTVTFRVPGDQADFFFRKGRTPEDSTSSSWYIVGWRDRPVVRAVDAKDAAGNLGGSMGSLSALSVEASTWGKVKAIYGQTNPPAAPFH